MTEWNQSGGDPRNSGRCDDLESPTRPEEAWTAELRGPVRSSPVLDRDTVFVGTSEGDVHAVDSRTGHRRWVFETAAATEPSPVVTREFCYACTTDGTLYALDPSTGDERWQVDLEGPIDASPTYVRTAAGFDAAGNFTASRTDPDGVLYVGDSAGVVALEGTTGEELWRRETEAPVVGSPAVDDGRVFVGRRDEAVTALDAETGEESWTAPTNGVLAGGPTIDGDGERAYAVDSEGLLVALDAETGQTWFTYEIDGAFVDAAIVRDDSVFVPADDGHLHVTDTTFGRRKVRGLLFSKKGVRLDGIPRGAALVGDVVCLGDSSGAFYAIDADDPDFVWFVSLEAGVSSPPAVGDGRLYAGLEDGTLVCLSWRDD
ncbi:PQQ-binding-like beta-propeller repeat protein [Natrialbaceae archaeon GCM10025810]|uniref:outer membrane protein assembly factor BamB family protein n=1 Tax=Halovalidus salilacus TaxID=3075124 RepID=UPI00361C0615